MSRVHVFGAVLVSLVVPPMAVADSDDPFEVERIAVSTRVVQAEVVDLDGDGRGDLTWVSVEGMPPDESRKLHVHYRPEAGVYPAKPDWTEPLPSGVAAYDLADVDGRAGQEILLLRRDRIRELSFHARNRAKREIRIPGAPTVGVVTDERGVDQLRLARHDLGAPSRFLVPGLGHAFLVEASGDPVARLDVGARANYFAPPRPGPLLSESEVELYFDHPRLAVGDVDGDGRSDVVSSDRHEMRVFLQREGGGFEDAPDRQITLGRLSFEDHIRSSGAVRVLLYDFDADEKLDLLVSSTAGSVFGGNTNVTLHRNVDGGWNLDAPVQRFVIEGGAATHDMLDLDGDGRPELISVKIPTGVFEIVEILLTRAIDAEVSIYRSGETTPFAADPWQRWKLGVGFSFDTFRPTGFVPTLQADVNGDGHRDLIGSGDGEALEIFLGDPKKGFRRRHASQDMDTGGSVRFGDADGDGLTDLVLYDSQRPGTPIRVVRNRGVLPAVAPSLRPVGTQE